MPQLFPMFLKLQNRAVLVVGAGQIAEQKIHGLLSTGALIRVVAKTANETVQRVAAAGRIRLDQREFSPSDLDGVFLVIAATGLQTLNRRIFAEAQRRGILCNVVDVPELCDFFYPAVVRRGSLQIAISTGGQSPSLAQKLRVQLECQFGPGYADWVARLGEARRVVLSSVLNSERKRCLLHSLAGKEAVEAEIAALEDKS